MTHEEQLPPDRPPDMEEIARHLRPRLEELLHRERVPPEEVEGLLAEVVREVRLRMPERWELERRLLSATERACRRYHEELRRQAREALDRAFDAQDRPLPEAEDGAPERPPGNGDEEEDEA